MPTWLLVPTLVQTGLSAVLCAVPLFDLLGYEYCLATCLAAAATAPALGLAVGRRARHASDALARAAGAAVLHLLPGLVLISLNASRVRNCNYGVGLQFFVLLPLITAIYGAVLGALIARLCGGFGRWLRLTILCGAVIGSLCHSLWQLFYEPPIFAFNHLWGYFAGSLYDEQIAVDVRLLAFRAGTLLRVAAMAATVLVWDRWSRLGTLRVLASLAAVWGSCSAYERLVGPEAGFRIGRVELAQALPMTVTRPGLTIHLPEDTDPALASDVADDHAFRLERLVAALEVDLTGPIDSYVYRDAAQKAHLMGGRGTMVAKPWLREIHIHGAVVPHRLMPHELAHAVAAQFGSPLLGLSARAGIFVNMGLVEGLAEALAPDDDALTLHVWARAMRDLQLAPDLAELLGPAGFWGEAPARAYKLVGSFMRYLLRAHGAGPLRAAYPSGDFAGAYGQPLPALVAAWQATLDRVEVSPREANIAAERFRPPSIFARTCAHEIADLSARAAAAPPAASLALHRQICAHLGDAPSARLGLAMALRRADDLDGFFQVARELHATHELNAVQRGQLEAAESEVLWQRGDRIDALNLARRSLAAQVGLGAERLAWTRAWAMGLPDRQADPLLGILAGRTAPVPAALLLERARVAHPHEPTYAYLLGRQLAGTAEPALAEAALATGPHPFAPIEAERLRLLGTAQLAQHAHDAAAASFLAYGRVAPTSGGRAEAEDLLARVAWQRGHQGG